MDVKRVFFIFLTLLWLGEMEGFVCAQADSKQIAMIIASNNFRDEELLAPKSIFEKAGYKVIIFSSSPGKAKGILGAVVKVDRSVSELNPEQFDAVIFVGGSGAIEYWEDPVAHRIASDILTHNRVLGAICIAPVTIANAGLLAGRRATVWPSEKNRLITQGATYTGKGVEIDGKIVTADGPQNAAEFAETILELLRGT